MSIRLAINGFGRIGRQVLRRILSTAPDIDVVVVNSPRGTPQQLAHLFTYDSVFGRWNGRVAATASSIVVDGHTIAVASERDARLLPWGRLGVDVVLDTAGCSTSRADAAMHLEAGARKVIVSAPLRDADATLVVGVNDGDYDPARHDVVSGASCTTNCLAPMAMVLHNRFGLSGGLVTSIHAYTRDQQLLDGIHPDLRRARAAGENLAPTKTGAARAIATVLPELAGKLVGIAVRVPVPDVSLVDLSAALETPATVEEVNETFRQAAGCPRLAAVLGVCDEPLVSSDFVGDSRSCVVDAASTRGAPDDHVKVLAWYDNEWAYACRMTDLVPIVARASRQAADAAGRGRPVLLTAS